MSERQVGPEEFLAPGRGRAEARLVHEALGRLADGSGGDVLREMAREVLSGRVGLHQALSVGAYADVLGERVRAAQEDWERLPQDERERQLTEARHLLESEERANPSACAP